MFSTPSRTPNSRASRVGSARASRAGTPHGAGAPLPAASSPTPSVSANTSSFLGDTSGLASTPSRRRTPASSSANRSHFRPPPPTAVEPTPQQGFGATSSLLHAVDDTMQVEDDHQTGGGGGGGGGTFGRAQSSSKYASSQPEEGRNLMMDDVMAVTSYSRLPNEVVEVLDKADFYVDALTASMDVQTGYAYLISRSLCYVWNFASRGLASPTCFTFSVPSSSSAHLSSINDLPFCGLVARPSGREPGFILTTPTGQVRFWEAMSASLTAGSEDRAQNVQMPLNPDEIVTGMQRCESNNFAISTSHSRMFRLNVVNLGGRLQAHVSAFSQPRGIFGRLFGSASSLGFGSGGITCIAVGPAQSDQAGRDVFAVGRTTIQKWRVAEGLGERMIVEQDVRQTIASSVLQSVDARFSAADSLAFEIVHAAVMSDGKLAVLYSQSKGPSAPLSYGIVTVGLLQDASSFMVTSVTSLRHSAHRDPRPYAEPRLSLPRGGPAAFVTFADAVVVRVLEQGADDFEELVRLKNVARDRFVGFGSEPVEHADDAVASLSLITATSGSILIELDPDQVRSLCSRQGTSAVLRQSAKTERLKLKLEHAIFFGESLTNPLAFDLPAEFEGTLITAAEELSSEILASSNAAVASFPFASDLRAQLADRLSRLRSLITFIGKCGQLGKLSQSSRRRLRSDAELLAAANDLWLYQNDFVEGASRGKRGSSSSSPLSQSIEKVMSEMGEGFGEDVVRLFFRHKVSHLVDVVEHLLKRVRSTSTASLEVRSSELIETNRIALAIYHASSRYRREFGQLYGISDAPACFEPWSAKPVCLDFLETLFHLSNSLISDRTRELGSSVDSQRSEYLSDPADELARQQRLQSELKSQLCALADFTLVAYEDRIAYLAAAAASGDAAASERELSVLSAKYRSVRPQVIHPLLPIGRSDKAFSLAERHGDFRTLTELCNDPSMGDPSARVEHYLLKYQQGFAFELYQWYIEQGQRRKLLEQKEVYSKLVLEFLERTQNSRIAWIHDLSLQRYAEASTTLGDVAKEEKGLEEKRLMLSLSKLAYVAGLSIEEVATVREQRQIEKIDDQLDLVSVHHRLLAVFEGALETGGGTLSVDDVEAAAERVTSSIASRLVDFPAFKSHFTALTKRLLKGEVLSSEDLIDLLTLKDPSADDSIDDFSTAVEVYIRAKDAPESRLRSCLRSIWRRTILADDWMALSDTKGVSDEELLARLKSTALYRTLRSVAGNESASEAVLKPEESLEPPSREMLEGRLQGAPNQEIDLLLNDHNREREALELLLGDSELASMLNEVALRAEQPEEDSVEEQEEERALDGRSDHHAADGSSNSDSGEASMQEEDDQGREIPVRR
ncbi:hypothetical protein IE53DRAFT_389101 [Violaceomyces palustris]|uniref:Uncharacterized protein n=1 Tax=Violaceomyces palustris TaxID=1673888 RepID=A0ACD0NS95_9BASI|nr:hypothetical protein IE53DRAFT_389101 [Violaceomyces palustris]